MRKRSRSFIRKLFFIKVLESRIEKVYINNFKELGNKLIIKLSNYLSWHIQKKLLTTTRTLKM